MYNISKLIIPIKREVKKMTVRECLETLNDWDFSLAVLLKVSEIQKKYFVSDEHLFEISDSILVDFVEWLSSTYDECTIL